MDDFKNKTKDLKPNFRSFSISDLRPSIPKIEPTTFELPTYNEDCEYLNKCPHPQDTCYKGAKCTVSSRCSTAEIRQMLSDLENPKQEIIVQGSNNQINQQGSHSTSQMSQNLSIEQIPIELIQEFKTLLKEEPNKTSPKWIDFLGKLSTIGGIITTLIKLFQLLG